MFFCMSVRVFVCWFFSVRRTSTRANWISIMNATSHVWMCFFVFFALLCVWVCCLVPRTNLCRNITYLKDTHSYVSECVNIRSRFAFMRGEEPHTRTREQQTHAHTHTYANTHQRKKHLRMWEINITSRFALMRGRYLRRARIIRHQVWSCSVRVCKAS